MDDRRKVVNDGHDAHLVGAVMLAAGLSEVFIPGALLGGLPDGAEVIVWTTVRDGRFGKALRLRTAGEVLDGDVLEPKEITA